MKQTLTLIGIYIFGICNLMAQDVNVKSKNNKKETIFKERAFSAPVKQHPLYIIDGVLRPDENPLKGLATDSIKDIKIFKDKAETVLYGARGSYGVIIITTKSEKVKND